MLDFIKELALAAGEIIKQGYYKEKIETEHKGSVDLVTEIDLASEKYIIARIRERFPTDSILAEEKPDLTSSGRVWIIDPLDGTTNFAHKFHPTVICMQFGNPMMYFSLSQGQGP